MLIEELWLVDDDFSDSFYKEYCDLIKTTNLIKLAPVCICASSAAQQLSNPEFINFFNILKDRFWKEKEFVAEDFTEDALVKGVSFAARFCSEFGEPHTFIFDTDEEFKKIKSRYEEQNRCRYKCDLMLAVKAQSEKEFWLMSRLYLFSLEGEAEGADNVQAIDFIRMQWST